MMYRTKQQKKGFSLIEVIISIALFTVVMTVALGALFMVINANKRAKSIKLVVNNVNLAIEGMSRDLRVGYNYCDSQSEATDGSCDSTNGSTQIWFTTDQGEHLSSFRLFDQGIQRRLGGPAEQFFEITGSDVIIEDMQFYIQGTQSGDDVQPFVTIAIRGSIEVAGTEETFQLQTTLSQRKIAP